MSDRVIIFTDELVAERYECAWRVTSIRLVGWTEATERAPNFEIDVDERPVLRVSPAQIIAHQRTVRSAWPTSIFVPKDAALRMRLRTPLEVHLTWSPR